MEGIIMWKFLLMPKEIIGTLLLVLGLALFFAKNSDSGKEWLVKKFGEKWHEKAIIQFLGWPLVVVVPLMYLPDQYWLDIIELVIAFVLFLVWRAWKGKQKSQKPSVDDVPGDAETTKP